MLHWSRKKCLGTAAHPAMAKGVGGFNRFNRSKTQKKVLLQHSNFWTNYQTCPVLMQLIPTLKQARKQNPGSFVFGLYGPLPRRSLTWRPRAWCWRSSTRPRRWWWGWTCRCSCGRGPRSDICWKRESRNLETIVMHKKWVKALFASWFCLSLSLSI